MKDRSGSVIDYEKLTGRFSEDLDFVRTLLGLFKTESQQIMANLGKAYVRRQIDVLRFEAHTLKGAAANLCAERLFSAAKELEAAAETGSWDEIRVACRKSIRAWKELLPVLGRLEAGEKSPVAAHAGRKLDTADSTDSKVLKTFSSRVN